MGRQSCPVIPVGRAVARRKGMVDCVAQGHFNTMQKAVELLKDARYTRKVQSPWLYPAGWPLDDDSAAQSKTAVDPRQQPGAQHGSKPKQIAYSVRDFEQIDNR